MHAQIARACAGDMRTHYPRHHCLGKETVATGMVGLRFILHLPLAGSSRLKKDPTSLPLVKPALPDSAVRAVIALRRSHWALDTGRNNNL